MRNASIELVFMIQLQVVKVYIAVPCHVEGVVASRINETNEPLLSDAQFTISFSKEASRLYTFTAKYCFEPAAELIHYYRFPNKWISISA